MKSTINLFKNALTKINTLILMGFVSVMTSVAYADPDFAYNTLTGDGNSDISDVAENFDNSMVIVFNTIKTAGVVFGLIFVFTGIYSLKKSQDQGSNVSAGKGVFLILIGGMLGALPFIFLTSSATMTGTGGTGIGN